jgi:hypothetical protein
MLSGAYRVRKIAPAVVACGEIFARILHTLRRPRPRGGERIVTSSYSMSARSRIDGGVVRPSALAVLRFRTIPNLPAQLRTGFDDRHLLLSSACHHSVISLSSLCDQPVINLSSKRTGDGRNHTSSSFSM